VLQLWVIAMVALVVSGDALVGMGSGGSSLRVPAVSEALSPAKLGASLALPLVIAALTHVVCMLSARQIDRRGSSSAVIAAERMLFWSRPLAVLALAGSILTLGWLGQVRALLGDLPAINEFVAILPFIGVFVAGWWSFYLIERRLRQASVMRTLDDGGPIYAIPTRGQYVLSHVRHDLLLVLVPLILIACWSEGVRTLFAFIMARGDAHLDNGWISQTVCTFARALRDETARGLVQAGMQLVGLAVVFTIAPLILRVIWDTVRMADSPLRRELEAVCAHAHVRVRDVLIWRTHGTMINGAAMGLLPAFRYILLTDALLENMSFAQVRAVMAHEVAHVKHRHIPWMVLGVLGAAGVFSLISDLTLLGVERLVKLNDVSDPPGWFITLAFMLGTASIIATLFAFGWISRRFEWQADAFAAQSLSSLVPNAQPGLIAPEAAASMIDALDAVASLNYIPRQRRSFRHGSIRTRQSKLQSIIGRPIHSIRQDHVVKRIKRATLVALAITIAAVSWDIAIGFDPAHNHRSNAHPDVGSVQP
jgi:STE24 endopeptidase